MTLTKSDIADRLFEEFDLAKKEAREIVDLLFYELKATLEAGEELKLSSLGNFELRDKVARQGRNPKTGEEALIEARRVVTFKPGPKLKDIISNLTKKESIPHKEINGA